MEHGVAADHRFDRRDRGRIVAFHLGGAEIQAAVNGGAVEQHLSIVAESQGDVALDGAAMIPVIGPVTLALQVQTANPSVGKVDAVRDHATYQVKRKRYGLIGKIDRPDNARRL